ncbi:expressed unknown protein [Seminavis robusta]|uniref:Uncharacterized protein n=1 Tax=Seminavis robusta TaxID=568900 RepID=A0A9N8DVR9_9STRA|nr:expressed unknown protein [Seminavis robusta]|eukprot:Sro398_g134620.1 n/a (453) ;mRNA; f:16120-17478
MMKSPRSPYSSSERGGVFALLFRFSQTMMFLLGLTYTIIVLMPLLQRQNAILQGNLSSSSTAASSTLSLLEGFQWKSPQNNQSCDSHHHHTTPTSIVIPHNPNRTITLVHVGKAGGVSLRRMTVIFCKLFFTRKKHYTPETVARKFEKCVDLQFANSTALAHLTKHYFHLEEYSTQELEESTSFLVTLRNPVDRIISAYRFSHPGNCNDGNRNEIWHPRGCEAEKHRDQPGLIQNRILYDCFPSPAMEEFAQAILRPWRRGTFGPNLTKDERRECRWLAREMVQGSGTWGSGPHMLYNYAFYAQRSIWKYPTKEVFGVRTEHELEDIVALDALLGGNGQFRENAEVSHGSEGYVASPLSTEAYQKLCCVLEMEIDVYQDLLQRVLNLNQTAKQETVDSLRHKCGITTTWTEWRVMCRKKLKKDLRVLKPSLVVNETKLVRVRDDGPQQGGPL